MQDFTYLTHKVIPKMWRNGNHAHIDMLHMYMNNPVHFTMDRNTQNDLILRGKNIDFEWVLPYQQMSIQLDRTLILSSLSAVENNAYLLPFHENMRNEISKKTEKVRLTIKTITFGIVEDVGVGTLNGFKKLLYQDSAKKIIWLQQNATCWNDVFSVLSQFSNVLANKLGEFKTINQLPDQMFDDRNKHLPHFEGTLQSLLKNCGGMMLNAILNELCDGEEERVKAFAFYVEYEDQLTGRGHFYDWINTGTLEPIHFDLNKQYFDDGWTNQMYDYVFSLLRGFSSAWKNQQILEKVSQPTSKKRKGKGRGKVKSFRYKQLHYDVNAGNIVRTKTISDPTSSSPTGIKMSPHQRGATFAYVWVTDQSLGEEEEIFDIKENHKGTDLYKVLRPRKGCSINGGGTKPVVGKIQSM